MEMIDKAAIVAEIEKRMSIEQGYSTEDAEFGYKECCKEIISFINSLEAKNVDFIKDIPLHSWQTPCADPNYPCENPQMDCINCPRFGHPQGTITITSSMDEKESEQLVGKATFQTDSWSEVKEDE